MRDVGDYGYHYDPTKSELYIWDRDGADVATVRGDDARLLSDKLDRVGDTPESWALPLGPYRTKLDLVDGLLRDFDVRTD